MLRLSDIAQLMKEVFTPGIAFKGLFRNTAQKLKAWTKLCAGLDIKLKENNKIEAVFPSLHVQR